LLIRESKRTVQTNTTLLEKYDGDVNRLQETVARSDELHKQHNDLQWQPKDY